MAEDKQQFYPLYIRCPDKRHRDLLQVLATSLDCEIDWEPASTCRAVVSAARCKFEGEETEMSWRRDKEDVLQWLDEIVDWALEIEEDEG